MNTKTKQPDAGMQQTMSVEISFPAMPLWKGVAREPFEPQLLEYRLGWDPRGFICQTTPPDVRRMVIESYSQDDYQFPSTRPGDSSWGDSHGERAIQAIRATHGKLDGLSVIELGAGTTYVGECLLRDYGVTRHTIVDPSIQDASSNPHIHVVRHYFSQGLELKEDHDLVVSLNCLEHVSDPVDFLLGVRSILKRNGGRALLVFPDNERQFLRGDLNAVLHEHVNCFSEAIVRRLALRCGLDLLEIHSDSDEFVCYFGLGGEPQDTFFRMDALLPKTATAFSRNLDFLNRELARRLADGAAIAFHGACNGLNNALAFCGALDGEAMKRIRIYDGDEIKHGRYMPLCPNPILPSTDPSYKEMDVVFVSAVSFFEPIQRHLVNTMGLAPENVIPYCSLGVAPAKSDTRRLPMSG